MADDIWERAQRLPPAERQAFMSWAMQEITRRRVMKALPTAGALAAEFDPKNNQTADLAMIDEALEWAFNTPDARLMISKPSQTGKALALATPIATPTGWTTMGELRVGDQVFDRNGEPCNVTWVSPTWTDRPCFTVRTGCGEAIVADEEHEWPAYLDAWKVEKLHTTRVLAKPRNRNAGVLAPAGLNLPDADLPLHPYLMGIWLGDGTSAGATITTADQWVVDRILDLGYPCKKMPGKYGYTLHDDAPHTALWKPSSPDEQWRPVPNHDGYEASTFGRIRSFHKHGRWEGSGRIMSTGRTVQIAGKSWRPNALIAWTFLGPRPDGMDIVHLNNDKTDIRPNNLAYRPRGGRVQAALKGLGVLRNKHIPLRYMRGSEKQRLELLQGLVDSDGYVSTKGEVEFVSISRRLAEDVRELVFTLGAKATIIEGRATIDGKDCGTKYRVRFYLANAATLPRKANRCRDSSVARRRYVWAEPCESVPTRCIEVDSPSHTYLAGRSLLPTHNSERVAVWGMVRALIRNPDCRIIIATHSEDLALTHSERIRSILAAHGTGARDSQTGVLLPDRLGIGLGAKNAASRWTLAGHMGGVVAVGVGTALPGKPADLLLLDDLYAGMEQADSPAYRRRVNLWWDTVASQRPGPGAPVIAIGTRWNEYDAHAYLMEKHPGKWRVLNFPAIAEKGLDDALGREPGVFLENPRGYTDWAAIRETKPARVWASMYQGDPGPTDGALFSAAWFDDHRIDPAPPLYRRIVGIDPAETGTGDEAGIIAGGLDEHGTVVLTDDASGHMSSAQWPRAACLLALRTAASEVYFEAYSAPKTYEGLLQRAYDDLVDEAFKLTAGLPEAERARLAVAGVAGVVDGVTVMATVRPFAIYPWKGHGNAVVRSTGFRHGTSSGKCRVVGHRLATMERQAVRWFEGQHSPDRVSAGTVVFDVLAPSTPAVVTGGAGGWGSLPGGM